MYHIKLSLIALLALLAGCNGPSTKPLIYPKEELQPTAIALATNVPEPPPGIESMTLEERVEMYTGVFKRDRFLGYEDIITAYLHLLPHQICEPDDSIDVLDNILKHQIQFFINGDRVPSFAVGHGYFYSPGDTCMDVSYATAQVNARLAPGLHIVTIRIGIPIQSRTIEYTRAIEVGRGSAEQ